MRIKLALILLFLCSTAWADTEYIYPSSDDSGWDSGAYTTYDDDVASVSDSDFATEATKNTHQTGTMTDLATADSDDTYNYIIIHLRSQLTPTVGNEFVSVTVTDGTTPTTHNGGSNATWTTDDSAQITTYNTFAQVNALTYDLKSDFSGSESVGDWQVSWLAIEVNYTAVEGGTTIYYTTHNLRNSNELYPFRDMLSYIDLVYHRFI